MPDPDLERLQLQLASAKARAARQPDEHADGPAYYRERDDIAAAGREADRLLKRVAELEQAGRRERQHIGIARRQLGIPDESHAARVYRITNGRARSTADCTATERQELLAEYRALGFKVKTPQRAGRAPSQPAMDRATMLTRVEQLLTVQALPWRYAEAIVRQQRGIADKGVSCPPDLCTDTELRALIAALDKRRKRLAARTPEEPAHA